MALLDRPRLTRLAEVAEDYLGVGLRTVESLERSMVIEQEFSELAGEVDAMALTSLDYVGGRPVELTRERRQRIVQRSRIAFMFDPLAGAESQLLGDFAFGKGVTAPTARDTRVQRVIDAAWTDANNQQKLTGYMAQRMLSNELVAAGELFITGYTSGGRFRVGRLDSDAVEATVPDPEDRNRVLWYMVKRRKFRWNFQTDSLDVSDTVTDGPQFMYWKHWRNYDDAVAEREDGLVDDDEAELITPPEEKTAKGVVFHLTVNQLGEQARGTPQWARSLRFFGAMNTLTESHVAMAQAASTFVARQTVLGGRTSVARAAAQVFGHVSELGASRLPAGQANDERAAFAPGGARPPAPGAFYTGNDAARIEALSLSSGAGQMQQTAQIVRAPIAASAGFGQHYLGDASDTNLATASTLELPATMRVESWQELFAQTYRWFIDRAIEAALKAGQLGSIDGAPAGDKPLGEMRLDEAEDRDAMAERVGIDLTYSFSMPFPGRRQLPDVMTFITGICEAFDPNGVNAPLRRPLLKFALDQTGMPDVARIVEDAIPAEGMDGGIGPEGFNPTPPPIDPAAMAALGGDPAAVSAFGNAAGGGAGGGAPPAGSTPPERETAPRVRRRASEPSQEAYVPQELAAMLDAFERAEAEEFRREVSDPALAALLALGPARELAGVGA